jgi:hypothetical protein
MFACSTWPRTIPRVHVVSFGRLVPSLFVRQKINRAASTNIERGSYFHSQALWSIQQLEAQLFLGAYFAPTTAANRMPDNYLDTECSMPNSKISELHKRRHMSIRLMRICAACKSISHAWIPKSYPPPGEVPLSKEADRHVLTKGRQSIPTEATKLNWTTQFSAKLNAEIIDQEHSREWTTMHRKLWNPEVIPGFKWIRETQTIGDSTRSIFFAEGDVRQHCCLTDRKNLWPHSRNLRAQTNFGKFETFLKNPNTLGD